MLQLKRFFLTRPLFYLFIIVFILSSVICRFFSADDRSGTNIDMDIDGEVYKAAWNKRNQFVFKGELSGKKITVLMDGKNLAREDIETLLKKGYVSFCGRVTIPENARNFGEFDYSQYLHSRMIEFCACPSEGELVFREKKENEMHCLSFYGSRIRSDIHSCLEKYLGSDYSSWVMSVMTGDTGYLEDEEKKDLSYAGFSHLVAVSGAHITYFIMPFELLMKKYTTLGLPYKKMVLIIPMCFLWFVAGGSPSITRAVIMACFSSIALFFRKNCDKANSLGLAGLIQIAVNPYSVFNTGFLLSYAAVISLIFVLPLIKNYFKTNSEIFDSMLSGVAVNVGIFPLLLYLFNGFSLIGAFANVVVSYVANFLCVGGYAVYSIEKLGVPDGVVAFLGKGVVGASEIFIKITEEISKGSSFFSRFEAVSPSIYFVIIYYCMVAMLFFWKKAYVFIGVAVVMICSVSLTDRMKRIEFVFFDVGQGSSALIKTCDGVAGVVDTGDGGLKLSKLLLKEGVDRLDFVIISHGHDDHYGGFDELISNVQIERVFIPSNQYDSYCNSVAKKYSNYNTEFIKVEGCAIYDAGKYSRLSMYESLEDESEINNGSIIVRFDGDWGSALLPGDAENKLLDNYTEKGALKDIDIMCLPHHGSDSSGSKKFLFSATPEYVIISCGKQNQYGHPSPEVLNSIMSVGVSEENIFRTDRGGAVRITAGKYPFFSKEFVYVWQKKMKLSQVFQI